MVGKGSTCYLAPLDLSVFRTIEKIKIRQCLRHCVIYAHRNRCIEQSRPKWPAGPGLLLQVLRLHEELPRSTCGRLRLKVHVTTMWFVLNRWRAQPSRFKGNSPTNHHPSLQEAKTRLAVPCAGTLTTTSWLQLTRVAQWSKRLPRAPGGVGICLTLEVRLPPTQQA